MPKLAGMLGLCKGAGKLILGFEPTADAIRARKAAVVLLAADLSPRSRRRVEAMAENSGVPLRTVALTLDELDFYLGKRAGILCTEDENFAKALLALTC